MHHRGQLSAYLRPMGAKVPAIYGGSADEPMAGLARSEANAIRSSRFPIFARSSTGFRRTATSSRSERRSIASLEAAEIHRRVIAAGGPALLFTNVKGAISRSSPICSARARRAELAFGDRPLRLIKRLVHLAETLLPPTPGKLWGARDVGARAAARSARAARVRAGARAVVDATCGSIACRSLTCWPEDGGPFVTLPLVYTTHPDRPGHNLGMYRLHVHDRAHDRDALADRQGRRLSLRASPRRADRRCRSRCFSAGRLR